MHRLHVLENLRTVGSNCCFADLALCCVDRFGPKVVTKGYSKGLATSLAWPENRVVVWGIGRHRSVERLLRKNLGTIVIPFVILFLIQPFEKFFSMKRGSLFSFILTPHNSEQVKALEGAGFLDHFPAAPYFDRAWENATEK